MAAAAAAAAAGAQGWFQCVYDGSMSAEAEIRRRPYHRNCGCALHRSHSLPQPAPCKAIISYPIRRSWSGSSISGGSSSSSSPRAADGAHQHLHLGDIEEDVCSF